MGLDLYAGTLTRYYTGQWQTVMQQRGSATGKPVNVIRRPGSVLDLDPKRAREDVIRWRSEIERDLAASSPGAKRDPFDWPEEVDAPYFTDKPDWHCYGAMVLLAAYTETGNVLPVELSQNWESEPVMRGLEAATGGEVRYPHLYFVPLGHKVRVASLLHMTRSLFDLNERTYAIPPDTVESRNVDVPPPSVRDFGRLARAGLTITLGIAIDAMRHRLPMLLDY